MDSTTADFARGAGRQQKWAARTVLVGLVYLMAACASSDSGSPPSTPYIASALTSSIETRQPYIATFVPAPTPFSSPPISVENAKNLTQAACFGGRYSDVAWSPSGQQFAVVSACGVRIYDKDSLAEVRFLGSKSQAMNATLSQRIVYSPDGRYLAWGDGENIILWDLASDNIARSLEGHTGWVTSLAFSPDGQIVASGSEDTTVRIWDVASGLKKSTLAGYGGRITTVAFSSDGSMVGSGSYGGLVQLWDVRTSQIAKTLDRSPKHIESIAFGPLGDSLAVAAGSSWLWNFRSGRVLQIDYSPNTFGGIVAFKPDGQSLMVNHRLWDVNTGEFAWALGGTARVPISIAFSPDGQTLTTVHDEGPWRGVTEATNEVRLLDFDTGQLIGVLEGNLPIKSLALTPDNSTAAIADGRSVALWNTEDGRILWSFAEEANVVSFSPDGQLLASGDRDGLARLRNAETGELLNTLQGHASSVSSIAFNSDGRFLVSGSYDRTARLWDVSNGQLVLTINGHAREVTEVAFSPDGKIIASASDAIRLWDINTGELLRTFDPQDFTVATALSFSHDGRMLATNGGYRSLLLLDVQTGLPLHYLNDEYLGDAESAVFGVDDRIIAAPGVGPILWDVNDGKVLWKNVLDGTRHLSAASSIAFASDMRFLISGHEDGSVRVWRVAP